MRDCTVKMFEQHWLREWTGNFLEISMLYFNLLEGNPQFLVRELESTDTLALGGVVLLDCKETVVDLL